MSGPVASPFCRKGHDKRVTGEGRKGHCVECKREWREKNPNYMKEWAAANPDKIREHRQRKDIVRRAKEPEERLRRYGLTPESYTALWKAQGEACAVCGTKHPQTKRRWHIDHCHETGVVRGILCMKCNTMIGLAEESADILLDAINYLKGGDSH